MKRKFLTMAILISGVFLSQYCEAQSKDQPGIPLTEMNKYLASDGREYHKHDTIFTSETSYAVIKYINRYQLQDKSGTVVYARSTDGYYYPLDTTDVAQSVNARNTIISSTGFKIVIGQEIKLAAGTMPDGTFKYIRVNRASAFRWSNTRMTSAGENSLNAAPVEYSGMTFKVVRIEHRDTRGHGTLEFAIISAPFIGIVKYEIDVENAIKSGEIEVPEQYRPSTKTSTIIMQQSTPADEILKYKKLLDAGAITQDEYDKKKAELLNK